jgi:hypothetical protein
MHSIGDSTNDRTERLKIESKERGVRKEKFGMQFIDFARLSTSIAQNLH